MRQRFSIGDAQPRLLRHVEGDFPREAVIGRDLFRQPRVHGPTQYLPHQLIVRTDAEHKGYSHRAGLAGAPSDLDHRAQDVEVLDGLLDEPPPQVAPDDYVEVLHGAGRFGYPGRGGSACKAQACVGHNS